MNTVSCIFWGTGQQMNLRIDEIVSLRSEYRKQAHEALKRSGADHIIYYRDERDANDNIIAAHFYPQLPAFSDADFGSRLRTVPDGFVGAVHALRPVSYDSRFVPAEHAR